MNRKLLASAVNAQRWVGRRTPASVAVQRSRMISFVLAFAVVAVWSTAAIAKPPQGRKSVARRGVPAAIGPKSVPTPENRVIPDGPRPMIVADEPIHDFKTYCREFTDRIGDTSDADDAIIADLLSPYA